jgi:CheY-like chemotaxis protein
MKILVAEDDMVSRRVLQATLVKWGHVVIVARDEAISRRFLKA